ncbi:MAG: diguanylate cyclase/phosphodiesterase [Proteobacteria bacterium]|nr:diguanylate cyclase/phosphodiesterase [Pseudomonadota bacterium]
MSPHSVPWWRSIRTKLVVFSIAVEIIMLGLLLANSFRLLNQTLQEQTHVRLEALTPLLNASLSTPLFQRDIAAIREILGELVDSRKADLGYIVVYDNRDNVFASAGSIHIDSMPRLDMNVDSSLDDLTYDTQAPLTVGGAEVGRVRFGLSLTELAASRDLILRQGMLIAGLEILLSFLLLAGIGYLLTRHIRALVEATRKVAAGDYAIRIPNQGHDEINLLGENFNVMSQAVQERVDALSRSEWALHEEKERAEVTLHSIGDGVITTDVDGCVRYMNPVAERLTGHTLASAEGMLIERVYNVIDEQTGSSLANPLRLCLADQTSICSVLQAQLISADGQIHSVEETASPIRDREGRTIGAVLVVHDVTASREASRQLEYQATHDALTGLLNRRQFERYIERAIESVASDGRTHAMCYMDLDQFKVVNDTCGHSAGDRLLVELSRIIRGKTREKDILGRLGGDEFGLLLYDVNLDQANFYAAEIRNSIRDYRFLVDGYTFEVGVSIGIVSIHADSGSLADVFTAVDVACYVAKDKGRNEIYISQMNDVEQARRQLEMQWSTRIPPALKENRFVLHYQKVLPLSDDPGLSPRCELLVRMVESNGTLIPPGRLIPAAERFRQMPDIDRWVIHNALKLVAGRGQNGGFSAYAINLSGQSLGQPELLDFVKREILRSGVRPDMLTFEITETAAIQNVVHASRFMAELKQMGCQFALDDFGSGLSSFGYLKKLPVDYLKIDGSFVRNMLHDHHDHSIVVAIAQIAKTLGIRCVAEFVGDHDTLIALREIGVDYGQGFFLHMPEPLDAPDAVSVMPVSG